MAETANKIKRLAACAESWVTAGLDIVPSTYREIAAYALLGGGKRLRPVLMQGSAELFALDTALVAPFGAAIEFLHASTLIHDDLPGIDNDLLRRGKPSLHAAYGEGTAILLGDLLVGAAMRILLNCPVESALLKPLQSLFSEAVIAVNHGQLLDLNPPTRTSDRDADLQALRQRHALKTGALIRASLLAPAIVARASAEETARIEAFSGLLGLLYQVVDDIRDETATSAELGKSAGIDRERGRVTYTSLLGLDGARGEAERICLEAKAELEIFGEKGRFLRDLTDWVFSRG